MAACRHLRNPQWVINVLQIAEFPLYLKDIGEQLRQEDVHERSYLQHS